MIQEQSSSQHHHHHQLPKYGSTGVARASKKNKPKKIPQRGLGVAQLEKLRLEEQKKMEGGGTGMSLLAPAAHARAHPHLLPLHPPPPPVPLGALARPPPADGGVFSPVIWDPADPMKHQYKRMPPPPLPMVSTGLSLTASSSHPTEPPSNQMYSGSRSSAAPAPTEEDRESAGLDRSWPFMFEGMTTAPAFRPTAPFAARMTREAGFADVCPDLMSRHEFRTTNYFSSANASYSDWSPPDLAYCKNGKASGCAGEPAFLSLSAAQPAILTKQPHVIPSSAHLPEYSDFGVVQSQASETIHLTVLKPPATE
ncbi:hypothetical protein PR202_gb27105 [Eleusine coracana subsp. coracana]|uniref:Uncharacterized protein n=1 Tax=Eleusine coracana subsp. coracana TaxID=191504 RepID=A0AAV5FTH1_ELECO|nr:hypothetical protein PR202_gb27105 [Eleusine coracana subsp. coracana]